MPARIGVYVCECGPNIKEALDTERVVAETANLPNVVRATSFNLLCAKQGIDLIQNDIKIHRLDRIVVAGCSPKEHEKTFQNALADAGLNPFLLQIANIREQCAWVCKDKKIATEKAITLTRAAVGRVLHHTPLPNEEIDCNANVLVIGAGVAGISAALTLAQEDRRVYLIDKSPCIGGRAVLYEDLFPTLACASCLLEPMLDEVLHHDGITVLTLAQVTRVLGQWGNFSVDIQKKARYIDETACIGCRVCIDACPVEAPDIIEHFLDSQKAVFIPYEGALPHIACIDETHCISLKGEDCVECKKACPFDAVALEQNDDNVTIDVGAIVLATGFDLSFPAHLTPGKTAVNVYSSLEFERLLNTTGPTNGCIQLKNGNSPKKIAFVHCVGSRSETHHAYCSGICCAYLLKFAIMTQSRIPDIAIEQFYTDFCLPGKVTQDLLTTARKLPNFTPRQLKSSESISITPDGDQITIFYADTDNRQSTLTVDMVVLGPAMVGSKDASTLAGQLRIERDTNNFFEEADPQLDPIASNVKGIFLAGCCQSPQDISQSIAQGQAAAGRILQQLVPGRKLPLPATTAKVDEDRCSGCKTCLALCEYGAVEYNTKKNQAAVNTILCQGCGTCVAGCPGGAMTARHFTDKTIAAEIDCLTRGMAP